MDINEILKLHGKTEKQIAQSKLIKLGDKLFGINKWDFISSYDSETRSSDSGKWYYVLIAENALTDGCNKSEYNKAGYILAIKDMYHENRHVWQHTKAWNDKSDLNPVKQYQQTTNLVRREFLKKYFPSIYYGNYINDPSEADAVKIEISESLAYFENELSEDKLEAEDILYEFMMSEDNMYEELLEPHKSEFKNIYDVLNFFKDHSKTCADKTYSITTDLPSQFKNDPDIDMSFTKKFLNDKEFEEYRKALEECKTGVDQDKVLEQAVIFAYPDIIHKAPLRLRKELANCRRQMEFDTWKPGIHAVPPNRINYSINSHPEEVVLTEMDLAGIPFDSNLIL